VLTRDDISDLARRYRADFDDVLMIALNAFGARTGEAIPRARMVLRLRSRPNDPLRLGLALARADSPFEIVDDVLCLNGEPVGDTETVEHDDALLGYFRKQGRVLVLNSHARSGCTGCVFCPNTLEGSSDPRLALLDDLDLCMRMFEETQGWHDLSHLEEVNVVTGCFHHEEAAIEHLALVRKALRMHAADPVLGILSSVIRTPAGLQRIAVESAPFMLVLTLECFTERPTILKHSKAEFDPADGPGILRTARELGHETGFTYIVGLEDIDPVLEPLTQWGRECTRFPNFQVLQAHNPYMARFAAKGADTVEYYLDARRKLESIFEDTPLRPLTWTNYRPLWYFSFAGEPLTGERI
jgi:hypothetical protein